MLRIFIHLILLFAFHSVLSQGTVTSNTKPLVGAIYWGMWDSYGFGNPAQMEIVLGLPQYRDRIPFFGRESTNRVVRYTGYPGVTWYTNIANLRINADQQWVADQEIRYAAEAGIDYFAYLYYGKTHYSQRLYKNSKVTEKSKVKMCWIIGPTIEDEVSFIAQEMGQNHYQTVMDGRPILYYLRENENCEDIVRLLESIKSEYKKQFPQKTAPYIVILNQGSPDGHYCASLNRQFADAFSSYSSQNGGYLHNHTYEFMRDKEIQGWNSGDLSAHGQKRVLWMSMGSDRRPRIDFPVTWEQTPEGQADPGNSINWAANPTIAQVKEQLGKAVKFIKDHPETCETQSLLLYAWNEHDEGGWISPTIIPGTNEINRTQMLAVKEVLDPGPCKTLLKVPYLSHETPVTLNLGENVSITANCEDGTPLWNNGTRGNNLLIRDVQNTTYHVKCVKDQCQSNERFIDVKIESRCEESPFSADLFDYISEERITHRIGSNISGTPMITNGVNFSDIFKGGLGAMSGTELTFDLGLNHGYGFLTGVVALDDKSACRNSKITFYLRDKVSMEFLYVSKEIYFDSQGKSNLDTFKIDVRNLRYLRMDTHATAGENGCSMINWSLLKLECPPDCEADVPPVLKASASSIIEGESVRIDATCTTGSVIWDDGSTELSRVFRPERTTAYTARCKTFGCDGSLNSAPLNVQVNVNCDLPHFIDYFKGDEIDSEGRKIFIGKNGLGETLRLVDSSGNIREYEKGFGVRGRRDVHFDLTEKRDFSFFKVTVGIDASDECAGPVRFRIMDMINERDMLTTPVIYPIGKGSPNYYDMELGVGWMQWFKLEVIPENPSENCGLYNWVNPRYECYSDIEEVITSKEEEELKVSVYPNPSSGIINIKFASVLSDNAEVLIVDILGREVYRKLHEAGKDTILVENIKSGKYIVSVNRGNKVAERSIVVF